MKKPKFDPEAWYTLSDLVDKGALPMLGRDPRVLRRVILADRKGKNVLKATVTGSGTNTRYRMKGANIIRFIALAEAGKV